MKELSQNQPPLPTKPEGWQPEDRQEAGKQLPRLEKPSLLEEADPIAPERVGILQEPTERMEDIREMPPAVPQRPLTDPEENIGEQNWVVMMLAEEGHRSARSWGSGLSRPLWGFYIPSSWGVGMLLLGKPTLIPES